MKHWVEEQTKGGRYSNASDYVRDRIRRDQERADKLAALQSLITEGMESGVSPCQSRISGRPRGNRQRSWHGIMAYRTTRKADQDIIDIYLWGCRGFGQLQAERYQAGLAQTLDPIGDNPRVARERAAFKPRVRMYPYQSHMIAYLLDETGVLIVRVLHGRQDWERYI